ncbi:MAG: group I truncated hemoglobin [Hyphomicrobium sp.]
MRKHLADFGRSIIAAMVVSVALAGAATLASAEDKSLYDRIGGYKGIAATVDDLVDRIYVNQTLNQNPALKAVHDLNEKAAFKLILATWVMENTGGPKVYFGRPMDKAHAHLSITNREFDVIMHECKETFYKFGVPEKEMGELMTALQSFREKIVTADASK